MATFSPVVSTSESERTAMQYKREDSENGLQYKFIIAVSATVGKKARGLKIDGRGMSSH